MIKEKTCKKCDETKPIEEFIKNRRVAVNCNSCNTRSFLFLGKEPNKKKKKKAPIELPYSLIITSVDRHDTLFLIKYNGIEVVVKHDRGEVIDSNHKLTDRDITQIKDFFDE